MPAYEYVCKDCNVDPSSIEKADDLINAIMSLKIRTKIKE